MTARHLRRLKLAATIFRCAALSCLALACDLTATTANGQTQVCSFSRSLQRSNPPRVLVLDPSVKIQDDSSDRLAGASEQTALELRGALDREFGNRGYMSPPDSLLTASSVQRIKSHFESLFAPAAHVTQHCKSVSEVSFKNELDGLSTTLDFDVIVLSRGQGFMMTKTDKVIDAVAGAVGCGGRDSDLHLSLAIVAPDTGKLIYYCESKATGDYLSDPDRLTKAARKCLKQFFKAPI